MSYAYEDYLSGKVIGYAINVHRKLGPGLLESVYQNCLELDLVDAGFRVEKEKMMTVEYKGRTFDHGYRIDLLVEKRLVLELKAVEQLTDVHIAQVLTYMRLGQYKVGLLLNFNVAQLKDGIKRLVL